MAYILHIYQVEVSDGNENQTGRRQILSKGYSSS